MVIFVCLSLCMHVENISYSYFKKHVYTKVFFYFVSLFVCNFLSSPFFPSLLVLPLTPSSSSCDSCLLILDWGETAVLYTYFLYNVSPLQQRQRGTRMILDIYF